MRVGHARMQLSDQKRWLWAGLQWGKVAEQVFSGNREGYEVGEELKIIWKIQ